MLLFRDEVAVPLQRVLRRWAIVTRVSYSVLVGVVLTDVRDGRAIVVLIIPVIVIRITNIVERAVVINLAVPTRPTVTL